VFRWLETKNVRIASQIVNWGNTPWYVNPNELDGMIGRIMATTNNPLDKGDVSIQLQLPDEWDENIAKFNVGMSALVETDICNPAWIDSCNKMNAVVLPSEFSKSVLLKSSIGKPITTRIEVVPESFPDVIVKGAPSPDLDLTTSFNFLIVSQMTSASSDQDRKNIVNTIRWICQEFADDDDVGIVVKTNSGRATTIDKAVTRSALKAATEGIKSKVKVYMLHGDVPEAEMAGLYVHPKVRALVSLTRGEGFGLPLLEAAASGLPVIATGWSAHTEFLGKKYISVSSNLVQIPGSRVDGRIFVSGARWADPDEIDFKKRVRKFRTSPDVPREWAAELQETVRKSYGWSAVSEKYDKIVLPMIG
jgi:glycosyltransferase involved in cell wall biosynthesis